MTPTPRGPRATPITILIAALGGEGGGVLTDWIVDGRDATPACGAERRRSPASRSAPARRPITSRFSDACRDSSAAGGRCWRSRPASAMSTWWWRPNCSKPAARSRNGFVDTATARLLIASTQRASDLTVEKMQMGDGRYDSRRLLDAVERKARSVSSSTWTAEAGGGAR